MIIHTFSVITIDENECESISTTKNCGENAICTNTVGSYYCHCKGGFTPNHNFTQLDGTKCQGKESLIWCISYDLCAAETTSESLFFSFQTSMNVRMELLFVVLMQIVVILQEVIHAHVKLATFPAMGTRHLLQDKEFSVSVRNY